ncbi:MAG: DUF2851 family protein [Bacteroidales bacterium]|jgi:hypothetical protein|nr:DUF2851 family protein [Bacteroidales bacterium]
MKEEFLHYLWQFRLLQTPLFTTKNEKIEVLKPGSHNTDAGPDFIQAKITIGETIWAGNIELHVQASDWNRHKHNKDKAYNTIILHVVYIYDADINLENGETIPCLELKGKFKQELYEKYEGFLKSKKWIPCNGQLADFPKINLNALYSRMSIERLEDKTQNILNRLEKNKNDWEETFYQVLAGGFGLKVNQEIFLDLAESLPLKKVLRQHTNLFQIEALLFGQSGLIQMHTFTDNYPISLKKEYVYLAKKHQLKHLSGHRWKFLRLRPPSFPTIRISQFAALVFSYQNLFSKMIETEKIEELISLFKVSASSYWDSHYVFNKQVKTQPKKLSKERINLLLINVIIPFVFLYGKQRNHDNLVDRALNFMDLIPAEKNRSSSSFAQEGLLLKSAFQTQALLQLKTKYCDLKKCLGCPIGIYLLK